MDKIYTLLEKFRLEGYYKKFTDLGVKDVRDFIDSIEDETLNSIGLTQVEKIRFKKMQTEIERLGSPATPMNAKPFKKSMEAFRVTYKFPKCSEPKIISDIDPSQNTLDDLMLRISFQENIGNDKAVCLYSVEGMPLTDDPFFNTWCLNERHIENGSELYAIFTPKENIRNAVRCPSQSTSEIPGDDTIRCHIMLKGHYEVDVDLDRETLRDLRRKLSHASGIPAHVLHAKNVQGGPGESLKSLGISSQSAVHFSLSSFEDESMEKREFFMSDISTSVQQTKMGMSAFFSALYSINTRYSGQQFQRVIAYIRKLTGCHALAQALHQLMCRNEFGTRNQKIAIVEGLYLLFRELLPSLSKRTGPRIIEDQEVFEYSPVCWAYLMSQAENESIEHETYALMSLTCEGSSNQLSEPVRIPGIHTVFDRAYVLEKINDEEKIPGCTEVRLKESSIQRATDIERILLSLPQSKNFPLWLSYNQSSVQNFQINAEKTFDEMTNGLSAYAYLQVTPPLQLKDIGIEGPRLLYIEEDNLGVYLSKNKLTPQNIEVYDCLCGKEKTLNVDELANELRDVRSDQTFKTSRIPQEAILVLVDSSSSMDQGCYESLKRIDAVKQLFQCFADRTMAYDFHHVVGLVTFGSVVKMFHSFTETLETFKDYVNNLQPKGVTPLYDALHFGISELKKVEEHFPDCRLRMMCLTDGCDMGSSRKPVDVAVKLINSNIVVDSILLGEEDISVLHGISNATGGCCFKPMTGKEALKLFEMETVLSLERRKIKKKLEASNIWREAHLTGPVKTCGFDKMPEVSLPKEINNKVTLTQNAFKKKIQESKSGRFMEKDKRILAELKNLHCDPHPFCSVLPSETDLTFWKILMTGPPETPYEKGTFELYCQFGEDYPMKPPVVRFLTPIYHCNVNSVGRICHNIFDRNYSAHVTMKEIFEAVFGLLIAPEPEDPLDSVLAEEFMSNRDTYMEQAKKSTLEAAGRSMVDMEKTLVGQDLSEVHTPPHLICRLTKKMFVDPVKTPFKDVYERQAIERELEKEQIDPFNKKPLKVTDLKTDKGMSRMVFEYRQSQIQETEL
ncbi:hypothetical protein AGOR_G00243780 [Albula goreensis]|uniref:Uncharacterized protein n=1 Tax=Albula goreensis TaxID=1534307 RepID=A0A8T3CHK9_9TELE|nr:hypothetical protein AGOR_G00243780 [Albula goreensis]